MPLRVRREEFFGLLGGILEEIAATGRLGVDAPAFSSLCFVGVLSRGASSRPSPLARVMIADRIAGHFLYASRRAG